MAEPFSIASGIAGIITLSSAVVTAGYKYFSSVRSAPNDLKDLIREIASLNTLASQLVAYSLSPDADPQLALNALIDLDVLQDCEMTILSVQKHLESCELSWQKNTAKKLLWPMKREDIVKGREHINRLCTVLISAVTVDNSASLLRLEKMQRSDLKHTENLARISHDIEEQKMLTWLSILQPNTKHNATTILQQPGTSDWLLEKKPIIEWIDSGDFLWLYGPSGVGKTVLVSNVINHLREPSTLSQALSQAVIYHYCEFTSMATLEPTNILGSLVRQLAELVHTFPQSVRDAYHKFSRDPPNHEVLTNLLNEITETYFATVFIIIDGIDECLNLESVLQLCHSIRNLPQKASHLKIMVSSRPEYGLRKAWSEQPAISIVPEDIKLSLEMHVRAEVNRMPKLSRLSSPARTNIIDTLVSRAHGMFRWVQCQLDVLCKIRTYRALQQALMTLPEGLCETYDRILDRIDERDVQHVIRMLKWLIGSEHPLKLEELAEAIVIDPMSIQLDADNRLMDTEEVLDLCGSFLTVRQNETVVLAHFSVQEYFLSGPLATRPPNIARFALNAPDAKRHITRCLLTYAYTVGLHVQDLKHDVLHEDEFPLFRYAKATSLAHLLDFETIKPWAETYCHSNDLGHHQLYSLIDYVQPPAPMEDNYPHAWFVKEVLQCAMMCYWNGCIEQRQPGVDVAPAETSSEIIAKLFQRLQQDWEDPKNVECILKYCGACATASPVCTAAQRGYVHSLQALLENGANVDGMSSPHLAGNPLLRALQFGCEEAVQVLDTFGVDFNVQCPQTILSTGFESVAHRGDAPRLVERLLLRPDANINVIGSLGRTIHYWAKNDSKISRIYHPFADQLEQARTNRVDFQDRKVVYTTIMDSLADIKGRTTLRHSHSAHMLAKALDQCGSDYYEYAAIIDEQTLASTNPLASAVACDYCPPTMNGYMEGMRYKCLVCLDTDLCANCYSIWKKSDGKLDFCKGHTYREIPRACWKTLMPGTVTEDGKTLAEIIDILHDHFSGQLSKLVVLEESSPSL
ncbi:hypothetical protein BKA66DRAFT_552081 [Pyrenochaeta sp. MPI-SDFR-AT-0127]|nr:hypothetical protein BKA66DRAFT_552081 [Pyrenochaeta sp. MPI-SDFR-AT-0127]